MPAKLQTDDFTALGNAYYCTLHTNRVDTLADFLPAEHWGTAAWHACGFAIARQHDIAHLRSKKY